MVTTPQLHVAVHSGSRQHRVATGCVDGWLLEEFGVTHDAVGSRTFFRRIARQQQRLGDRPKVCINHPELANPSAFLRRRGVSRQTH